MNKPTVPNPVLLTFLMVIAIIPCHAQQETEYFDFWNEGKWISEITILNGDTIQEKDSFLVQKMAGKNAFQEDWNIFIGDGEYVQATTIRAFDKETNRWKLFYIDDLNAQTWDSQMSESVLWFYKQFTYNGKIFYSRQSWSPRPDGSVLRIIERSDDNKNWNPRYWQIFRKQP